MAMSRPLKMLSLIAAGLVLLQPAGAPAQTLARSTSADHAPRFLVASASGLTTVDVASTPILQRQLSLSLDGVTLKAALSEIAAQSGLYLAYSDDDVPVKHRIRLRASSITAAAALTDVLLDAGVDVVFSSGNRAVLKPRVTPPVQQPSATVVGRVTEAGTGAPVAGALVAVDGTRLSTATGQTGRFSLRNVPQGTHNLVVRHIGYGVRSQTITVGESGVYTADIELETTALRLDEVVVTGTAFATEVRTLSNPITVITATEIQRRQPADVATLLRGAVPGVMALTPGQDDYFANIYVRGNASWGSAGDFIKIYIDGVEVAHSQYISTIDPRHIERIEIIRGPQASTIYGAEAASGVLQIFTKKGIPGLDRPRIEVSSAVGIIQSDYAPSDVGRPTTQDHSMSVSGGSQEFSYRVGASYSTIGQWLTGYGSDLRSLSSGLRAVHGDLTAELTVLWSVRDMQYANSPVFAMFPASPFCPQCGQPDLRYPNFGLDMSQNTTGLTLGYRATPRWQHSLTVGDDQNRYGRTQRAPHLLTPADTFVQLYNQETRRRSLRYNTAYDADLSTRVTARLTGGLDYWAYDVIGSSASNLRNAHGVVRTSANTSASFQNNAWWNAGFFSMAEVAVADQVFLTLAARVDDNSYLGEDYGRAVSPRAGMAWVRELGPAEVKVRAQHGLGIRPPPPQAKEGQILPVGIYLPNPDIGPEEKIGWDAGVDVHWRNSVTLSVTRYDEEGRNLIQPVRLDVTTSPQTLQYQNIGNVGSKGWELEGRAAVGRFVVGANYTYADNKILALSNQYVEGPNQVYQVGDRMMNIPTYSVGGTASVRVLNGGVSTDFSMIRDWRALDYHAYYGWVFGGETFRGGFRDYYVEYSDALWKWNAQAEQGLSTGLTGFVRVNNLTNNQNADMDNLKVTPGRATTIGVRWAF
jgi:outer membrane receptor protein involved in Fe transport